MNISLFINISFERGKPLKLIQQDYSLYVTDASAAHQQKTTMIKMNSQLISAVRVLMGQTTELELSPSPKHLIWADIPKITISFIFCRYQQVIKLGRVLLRDYPNGGSALVSINWFVGLASISLSKERGIRHHGMRTLARRCLKNVDRMCTITPDTWLGKLKLLQAEVSSISSRRHTHTVRKYLCAIAIADSSKNPFEGAMAHERYGRYLRHCRDLPNSLSHLRMASSLYLEWNAYQKVAMLEDEIKKVIL